MARSHINTDARGLCRYCLAGVEKIETNEKVRITTAKTMKTITIITPLQATVMLQRHAVLPACSGAMVEK
jgi:hypothetical protein